ncbi:hypothetical protein C5749_01530 [Sphingobacterium gobiense]|uniref:Uncharacterized protein n=1 Tax=Sphingobacterium gobiense TaxID=1382456 RepID=A0A2S9JRX3_9SPHI|nr:hypothetical protein C5749_01530 [Sphingobacterium gobiense]
MAFDRCFGLEAYFDFREVRQGGLGATGILPAPQAGGMLELNSRLYFTGFSVNFVRTTIK